MPLTDEVRSLFRKWGRRGGRARAVRLSQPARTRIARKAARARWDRRADFYEFPAALDLGEIAPGIVGGSMTAAAVRQSMKRL